MIETRWVALTDGLGTNQKLLYAKNGFFRSYKFVAQTDGGYVPVSWGTKITVFYATNFQLKIGFCADEAKILFTF